MARWIPTINRFDFIYCVILLKILIILLYKNHLTILYPHQLDNAWLLEVKNPYLYADNNSD